MKENKQKTYEVIKRVSSTYGKDCDGDYLILGGLTKERAEELVENLDTIEAQMSEVYLDAEVDIRYMVKEEE